MVDDRLPPVKVSVIIPAYKAEHTIAAALDSVLAQAAGSMEVIVVDDASPDATLAGVDAWLREHPGGGRLIAMPRNGGPAAARNRGAAEARGEWLAFLDSDDLWLPWRLATQLALAARHPDVDLWCGGTIGLDCALPEMPPLGGVKFRPVSLDDFLVANPVATTTVLLRREAFRKAGGFDEQFRGPEDYDLWMRVAAAGRLAHLDCPLGRYRSETGSLSMDDRKFLPQVLRVVAKAFGMGGVFHDRPGLRNMAVAAQYWSASWMAFQRNDRFAAVRHWFRAYFLGRRAESRLPQKWFPLLWRYLAGKRGER